MDAKKKEIEQKIQELDGTQSSTPAKKTKKCK